MSVAVMLQALGWVSVVWLVGVHLLIQHGRLPPGGTAYRVAGCVAAACVVAASAAEELWPVAVLGLLWLRIEVFGHRHHPEPVTGSRSGEPGDDDRPRARRVPIVQPRIPVLPAGAPARDASPARRDVRVPDDGRESGHERPPVRPHLPHPHLPHPHLPHVPHPHLGRRTVDRVFKIEMAVVIVIALVMFGVWAEQQRTAFTSRTNTVVCSWIDGCP